MQPLPSVILILVSMSTASYGLEHDAKNGAKVFVIESATEPAVVVPLKAASDAEGVIMRMPDLDKSPVAIRKKETPVSEREDPAHSEATPRKVSKSQAKVATRKPESKPMQFSKARIEGTLRLPRVKFARVGVPVDIREELPSLDFTSKSLRDSDF